MISVALDSALSLRNRGELVCAPQQLAVVAGLLERLADSLVSFCEALANRGRYIGDAPKVEPLNVGFFRGNTGQTAAGWNALLHRILLGDRARFIHKLKILSETMERLENEFASAVREIAKNTPIQSSGRWRTLDSLHYDFNTCLRETEVVFKSFLRALPVDQLVAFTGEIKTAPLPRRLRMRPRLSRASA
ncbi:MAG TPA: hypothetical protein VNE63_05895 [Candidatus Acidoferrales bacterium]|nr:hypothetical protein [Candidatus Acidoferrales bacterium]